MNFNKRKFVRLSLNLTLLSALFPCVLLSADLRQRNGNVIVSKTTNMTKSGNNTDVINISDPSKNGVSHNQFEDFNVHDGVIFNNSLLGGNSQIGGWVDKNPYLKHNANTIINEITSKQASGIHGNVEVFGKSANLIFANENGFSVNGASFLNTTGVTLTTGQFSGNVADVKSNGKISIGDKGVVVDGDYFNVISRSIDIAGSIAHYQAGKHLSNINFIAGLNKVDLSNGNLPKILASRQADNKDDKIDYGIDGRNLGSMYADTVTLVSTEEGVGVRHTGVIRGLKDIIVKVNGNAQFQALGVNQGGSVDINAKDITTSLIDADTMRLNGDGKVTNEGLYRGKNIKIDAKDFENAKQTHFNKETQDIFKTSGENSQVDADNLDVHTKDKMANFGSINTLGDVKIDTGSFENQGKISANKDVHLTLNKDDFVNGGEVFSQDNIYLQANKDLTLNNGNLYAKNLLDIKSLGDLHIDSKLENSSSIGLEAKNIYNKDLVASGKDLTLSASGDIVNDGYFFARNDLKANASHITNNSTFNSSNNAYLNADTIDNNGLIFANKDINIEVKSLNNNASLTGTVQSFNEKIKGDGWANYGDTLFKRWNMEVGIDILKYINHLDAKQASIQAGGNININTKSKDKAAQINNSGKIVAQGNINSYGNINNRTLSEDLNIEDILSHIKLDGFFAKEYLGSWNTNWTHYFTKGGSLLDALRYFASNQAKNHQRESAWNALKNAAAHNEALNLYFSLLFGSDYASKRFVPDPSTWNHNAKVVFKAKSEALIASNGELNLNSKEFNQGLVSSFDKNSALIKSHLEDAINTQDLASQLIPDIVDSGFFHFTNKTDDGISYEYTTESSAVNTKDYFGFEDVAKEFNNKDLDNTTVIGDSFFQNQLLKSMYAKAGMHGGLSDEDIKRLLENGAKYANEHGLKLGEGLGKNQTVDDDMILFEKVDRDGKTVFVPRFYFSHKTLEANKGGVNIAGKNGVDVNTDEFDSSLGNIASEGTVNINANDKVNLHSSNVSGKDVNIQGDEVNVGTLLGVDEKGSRNSINKSQISGKDTITITSNRDINVKNSDVVADSENSKIVFNSKGGNVNISNDYSNKSSFNSTETATQKSNTSINTDEVLSSNVKGGTVDITSKKDVNVVGSNIDANHDINVNANNVNIADAHENSQVTFDGIHLTKTSITYENSSIKNSKSVGSNLNSKGNININANNDLNIEGSNLQAHDLADLKGKNINIKNGENEISYSLDSSGLHILGYQQNSVRKDSSLATSSNISGDKLNLQADNKATITGSKLNGGDINIDANDVDFVAAKNTTHTQSDSLSIGVFANANLGLAGHGVNASYSFAQQKSGVNITDGSENGERNLGSSEVGLELDKSSKTEDETSYLSNNLKGSNITVNAKNDLDIGGADFDANKDINLKGGEIKTTKYEDTKTQNTTGFGIYVKERIESGGLGVAAINQTAENFNDKPAGSNYVLPVVQSASNAVSVLNDNLIEASSGETIGFRFHKGNSQSSSENTSKIHAGGKVNLESTKGDIVLNGVDVSGDEINVKAKDNFIANAAKKTHSSSDLSFETAITKKTTVGYNLIDGADVGGELEGFASGSRTHKENVQYHNAQFNANNISVSTGKDAVLNGANMRASNDVHLDVGGKLEVKSLTDTSKSERHSTLLAGSMGLDLSSNHIITGDFSGTVGVGYSKSDNQTVGTQSGISAGNELSGHVNGDLVLEGGILNSDVKKGNLALGGRVVNSDVSTQEESDGADVEITGATGQSASATVSMDDHIDKIGMVDSATNITINNEKRHGLSEDTQNTRREYDYSWSGGNVKVNLSVPKIKEGIKHFLNKVKSGSNSSDSSSSSQASHTHESSQSANASIQNTNASTQNVSSNADHTSNSDLSSNHNTKIQGYK
ncbi:hemagglutinin repeat-containing protein [Campylobacter bilis]|uniref:hemagglutinin repeat-containing protein n=1 Tax=Campylobacter bilis TaxID=2691918 RepID=UPI00130E8503|nr:filamentous hemagglutinin N-terminal domain-containing protein [Campylobacter bilis]MPV63757.1 filamentous hemagglutinin N-terminal domain-containing protein [Campylobacter hepaticus]